MQSMSCSLQDHQIIQINTFQCFNFLLPIMFTADVLLNYVLFRFYLFSSSVLFDDTSALVPPPIHVF